ncbi:MAG: nucleotidyltransferase family protein [Armatimonadetes bacterium]|nr:nucleotidyltransferase family protein [Armatimonadota bacterium]
MLSTNISLPLDEIAAICRRFPVRRLSLFGSVLRDDFTPDSDIDMLVEFEPQSRASYFTLAELEVELSDLLDRTVDLNTAGTLSRYFRDEVLAEAEEIYGTA